MSIAKILTFTLAAGLAVSLHAEPILGGRIVVKDDGHVTATYLAGYGGYSDDLLLYLPVNGFGVIFNNKTTPTGTTFDLGTYAAGTDLQFAIYVRNTGNTWFTGAGSNNSDGNIHAQVINDWTPGQTLVGFEDMVGVGDRDFDDFAFTLSNSIGLDSTGLPSVPEPGTLAMLGMGLLAFGLAARRRRA